MSYNFLFRFILIGDSAVGKSCILLRYQQSTFKLQHQATIGIEYTSKIINIQQPIKLEIWDTSGQEAFRSIARSYYRNCSGVLMVYDVNNRRSFENVEKWLDEITEHANDQVTIMLIGNKIDLVDKLIFDDSGDKWSFKRGMLFGECSAKTGQGVTEAFEELAKRVLQKVKQGKIKVNFHGVDEPANINHNINNFKKKKRFYCC